MTDHLNERNELSIFQLIIQNKLTFFLCVVLSVGIGFVYLKYAQKIYSAKVTLVYADQSSRASLLPSFGGLSSIAGLGGKEDGVKVEAIAILKSQSFALKFIKTESLSELYSEEGGASTPNQVYKNFSDSLGVKQDRKTGKIELSITLPDRQKTAEIANKLVEVINERMKSQKIKSLESQLVYLERELRKTSVVEVRAVIFGLMGEAVKSLALANTKTQFVFKTIDAAVQPDHDDFIAPKKLTILLFSIVLAFLATILISLQSQKEHKVKRLAV